MWLAVDMDGQFSLFANLPGRATDTLSGISLDQWDGSGWTPLHLLIVGLLPPDLQSLTWADEPIQVKIVRDER